MFDPNGVVLYRGPSLLDGRPAVCVAVGLVVPSENVKTGPMVQTYILRDGKKPPYQAVRDGDDATVCGDCKLRRTICYVLTHKGVNQVWLSLKAGRYPPYERAKHAKLFRGKGIRFGAYGDPAAIPYRVWAELAELSSVHTGYTHQWKKCSLLYRRLLMASADTPAEAAEAQALGYRTFRTRLPEEGLLPGEIECPASDAAGKRLTCLECGACWGNRPGGRGASVSIAAHGPNNKVAGYRKLRALEVLD